MPAAVYDSLFLKIYVLNYAIIFYTAIGDKMELKLYTNDLNEYLKCDAVVDFDNASVRKLADAEKDLITCSASEVLNAGHGICFAKSHLLAAILRAKNVPAGFCYQKLILDDETAPVLICHGLNGVYIRDLNKWIRLDARGNKVGVDAQFSIGKERLAFPIRPEKGEEDILTVFPNPDKLILRSMKSAKSRKELWSNLPSELEYTSSCGDK